MAHMSASVRRCAARAGSQDVPRSSQPCAATAAWPDMARLFLDTPSSEVALKLRLPLGCVAGTFGQVGRTGE